MAEISTTEGIKRALAAGVDQPKEIAAYLKEHFGLDVKTTTISTTKYAIQKREAGGPKTQVAAKRTTAPKTAAVSYDVPPEELASAMRDLVKKYGPDAVVRTARLAGLFA